MNILIFDGEHNNESMILSRLKGVCIFLLFFIITYGAAQNTVLVIPNLEKKIKQSFNVVDETSGNFALFVEDNNYVYGTLYSNIYETLGTAKTENLPNYFSELVGYQILNKKINLLMSTGSGRQYGLIVFDFETGKAFEQELEFKLEGEKFIDATQYNNHISVLTVSKKGNHFNVHTFDENLNLSHHSIKLDEDAILDRRNRPMRLYELLTKDEASGPIIDQERIEEGIPNALEVTAKPLKLYKDGSNITLTSDKYDEFTYVIKLDVKALSSELRKIEQISFGGSRLGVTTNSFFVNDTLYQLKTNGKELSLRSVDVSTTNVIKEHRVSKKNPISFKNTTVFRAGSDEKGLSTNGKSSAFLKKISGNNAALSVYKRDGLFEVTYGASIKKDEDSAIILGAFLFGAGGAIAAAAINGLSGSFGNYNNTNAVRTTGLFDADFNHVEGSVQDNIFDKIQAYIDDGDKIGAPTLFKMGESYFLGYYKKRQDEYHLVKFNE